MKKIDRRVDIRHKRAHIRGANIPVELLIGLGVAEVKKNYPWLQEDQITDALDYISDSLEKYTKGAGATPKTKIQTV